MDYIVWLYFPDTSNPRLHKRVRGKYSSLRDAFSAGKKALAGSPGQVRVREVGGGIPYVRALVIGGAKVQ